MTATIETDIAEMRAGVGGLHTLLGETNIGQRYKSVDDLLKELLADVPGLVERYLDDWRGFCAKVVGAVPDDVLAGKRPIEEGIQPDVIAGMADHRDRWVKSAGSLTELLQLSAELNNRFTNTHRPAPVDPKALKRYLLTVTRLARDAEEMTSPGGVLAAAVRWPRIDRAAFRKSAERFASIGVI
jgi:hypothetical protein